MLQKCKLGNQYELVVILMYDSYMQIKKERERKKFMGKNKEIDRKSDYYSNT